MGRARFLQNNLITAASMLSASSNAPGRLSNTQKSGAGAGTMATHGTYTGATDRDYLVRVLTGGALGTATVVWSRDGGLSFDPTPLATATTPVTLEDGIAVIFAAGPFLAGDVWAFRAYRPHGVARLLELDPNTEYRSAAGVADPIDLVVDLGAAAAPDTLILGGHNLTAAATIALHGDGDAAFGSLDVEDAVAWARGALVHDLTTTPRSCRHWRVRIADPDNPDGELRIASLFLGTPTALSKNVAPGVTRGVVRFGERDRTVAGLPNGSVNAVAEAFTFEWLLLHDADRTVLRDVTAAMVDAELQRLRPVWFQMDDAVPTLLRGGVPHGDVYLCLWEDDLVLAHRASTEDAWDASGRLVEVPRTRPR